MHRVAQSDSRWPESEFGLVTRIGQLSYRVPCSVRGHVCALPDTVAVAVAVCALPGTVTGAVHTAHWFEQYLEHFPARHFLL